MHKGLALIALAGMTVCNSNAYAADISTRALEGGKKVILLQGEIVAGDAAKIRKIAASEEIAGILLSSQGGNLGEALEIGRIVSVSEYGTAVPSGITCASSCALIWLASSDRLAGRTARIGFHAGYVMEDNKPIQSGVGNAMVGRYLTLLNLPPAAIIFATSAKPEDMSWIDTSNPGAEGIPYKIMGKDPSAPSSNTVQARDSSVSREDDGDTKTYGKWSTFVTKNAATSFTVERGDRAPGEEFAMLAFECYIGTKCRYSITFVADKLKTGCDAGDSYDIRYQVDGYESKKIDATCGIGGDELILSGTQQFAQDIINETNVTFRMSTTTAIKTIVFPLIGHDQAYRAMVRDGHIRNGMGASGPEN